MKRKSKRKSLRQLAIDWCCDHALFYVLDTSKCEAAYKAGYRAARRQRARKAR